MLMKIFKLRQKRNENTLKVKKKLKALFIYIADRKASTYSCRSSAPLGSTPQHHWYAATHSMSLEGIW